MKGFDGNMSFRMKSVWWMVWSVALALVVACVTLSVVNLTYGVAGVFAEFVVRVVLLGLTTIGMVIVSRRPRNAVGWIVAVSGFSTLFSGFAEGYGVYVLFTESGWLPGGGVAAWFAQWAFIPSLFTVPSLLFLLFPDGRLIGRRWGIALCFVVAMTLAAIASVAFRPAFNDAPFKGVANPFGSEGFVPLLDLFADIGWPGMTLGLLISAVAMILRLRSSRGEERQQLKWIAVSAAVIPVASLVGVAVYISRNEALGAILTLSSFFVVSFAAGYAILRYRLYDIDVIINRTLVYGSLSVTLALVYFGGVTAFQRLLTPLVGEGSQLAIVVSTLAIAALFNPLRRRIQAAVDRRFYRQKYDARLTLEAFSKRLRDETDLENLADDLLSVVRKTMHPEHAGLWLRHDFNVHEDGEDRTR